MGIPVVIVTSGGLGVTVVSSGGIPMTIATNGFGIPVRSVTNGLPVTGITFGPDVTAPIITSSNAISQPENAILNHVLAANEAVTWAKVGGADTAKFTLVGNTLTLPAKDFENPDDAGLNNTYIVQVQATDTASNVSLVQTITVTITDVFEVGPTAPVLAMDPAWVTTDNTPDFTIDIDDTIGAGDSIQLQIQAAGGDWSSPIENVTHVITAPEDTANEIALALGSQSNASYEARARVNDGTPSAWSNTVSFTIAAVAAGRGLLWGTDAIMWGADYMTWETPPAVTITATDHKVSTADLTSYTFTGVNLGTAASNRKIIVSVGGRISGVQVLSYAVKLHVPDVATDPTGTTMTSVITFGTDGASSNSNRVSLVICDAISGTSGEVVVAITTSPGGLGLQRCGIGVWNMVNAASSTASDTDSSSADPSAVTLTVPANGAAIGYSFATLSGAGTNTWTGLSEDFDEVIEATICHSAAHVNSVAGGNLSLQGDWSVSATTLPATVYASWAS